MIPRNTLDALERFPSLLRRSVAEVPIDALDWRPASWDGIPSEQLTIRQQVCHVRDIEIDGYQQRFARMLKEANPTLDSLDTYALAEARDYDHGDIALMLNEFEMARANTIRTLSSLGPEDLRRPGGFEGYGRVTVQSLVHYLSSHDQQHLAGIEWLLGQFAASAIDPAPPA